MNAEHRAKIASALVGRKLSAEHREKNQAAMNDPAMRTRLAEAKRSQWRDPEKRAKMTAAQAGCREKKSETMRAMWGDPEYRARVMARFDDPETLSRMSEAMKAAWSDPELGAKLKAALADHRSKQSERNRALWADPEYRARMREIWDSPEFRAKQVAAHDGQAMPEWLGPWLEREIFVSMLRDRDGDLCQLCLQSLDFDQIAPFHPRYTNIDHIRPRAVGGNDDPVNLWLAHGVCNQRKGARHVGRADGTTNPQRVGTAT